MGIYAYTSIADVVLKLLIVFLIITYDGDRLILLSVLSVCVGLGMRMFYWWYCSKHFKEAHYSPQVFDKSLLKELTVFSGWNLLNNGAWVFATQGVNMLVNVYFGVAYNTARGIAQTVNGAVQGFVGNFTMAFSPQITKSYAAGDKSYAVSLGNRGTKFAWMMMYIFIVPVCCEAETLLRLWLGQVPDGKVKRYTVQAAITAGLIFPLVWILYYLGAPVWTAYLVFILDFLLLNVVRIYNLKKLMDFSICQFLREVFLPCLAVSVLSFVLPLIVCYYMEPSLWRFFINVPVAVLWTCICCVLFGLNKGERLFLCDKMKTLLVKLKR